MLIYHQPAVKAAKDLHLKAVYSRSRKSAQDLAGTASDVDIYSDDSGAGHDYADLLARDDIQALIIGYARPFTGHLREVITNPPSLPILIQPDFIRQALLAGKHVLSEKPIAKDVATARELLEWYRANIDANKVIWAVGENYRYLTKFLFAAERVRELGAVKNFRVNVHNMVKQDNKYFRKFKSKFKFSSFIHVQYANMSQ